jgi:hypothetical protein
MNIRKRIVIIRGIKDRDLIFLYPINIKFLLISTQGIQEWIPEKRIPPIYLFDCETFEKIFGWIPKIGSKQEIYIISI